MDTRESSTNVYDHERFFHRFSAENFVMKIEKLVKLCYIKFFDVEPKPKKIHEKMIQKKFH